MFSGSSVVNHNHPVRHGSNDNSVSDSGGSGTNSVEIRFEDDSNSIPGSRPDDASKSKSSDDGPSASPSSPSFDSWPASVFHRLGFAASNLQNDGEANLESTVIRNRNSRMNGYLRSSHPMSECPTTDVAVSGWQEIRINEQEADALSKYNDFETIDWVRELRRDRERHFALRRNKSVLWASCSFSNILLWLRSRKRARAVFYYDAVSAWLCLLLVAVLAAFVAGFIDIAATWLTNLTTGLCVPEFWFNREQCCWSSNEAVVSFRSTNDTATRCLNWRPWSELLFSKSELSLIGGSLLQYLSYVLCSVLLAALAAQLVHAFAPYASGSGISEIKTILSGFVVRNYLGGATLIVKSITLVLAVASGLVLGKEGPLVHVACCCGNVVARLFPKFGHNEAKKREILSAAAGAGFAVAFGAPLGGVLFSLEEVSYYFPLKTLWRSFFCALAGALILRTINPFGNARLVVYYIDYHAPWCMFELIPFMLLGALGGILGALFIKGNHAWCRYRKESALGRWPRTEVVVISCITALASWHNVFLRASLGAVIERMYQRCSHADDGVSELCDYNGHQAHTNNYTSVYSGTGIAGPGVHRALWQLLVALVVKVVLWIFTVGIKIPTGLFVPSLAIGAILGRIVGIGVEQAVYAVCRAEGYKWACGVHVQPGLYAMLGSAALMAGVTRMTVTLVVMMLEVTGGLEYIVPLMLAVMVAKWVGDACEHLSIYDVHIELNTYPYLDHKSYAEDMVLSNNTLIEDDDVVVASDVMTPPGARNRSAASSSELSPALFAVIQDTMTVGDLEALCASQALREPHGVRGFPVVMSKREPYLVGFVLRRELKFALDKIRNNKHSNTDAEYINDADYNNRDDAALKTPVFFVNKHASSLLNCSSCRQQQKPIQLSSLVDFAPITVTSLTTIEIIIDLFRKLGLRHILVTDNGKLSGIITKKDVVRFLKRRSTSGRMVTTMTPLDESIDSVVVNWRRNSVVLDDSFMIRADGSNLNAAPNRIR